MYFVTARKIIIPYMMQPSSTDDHPSYTKHIFAVSVFEDWLYWTDWEARSVMKAHKFSGNNVTRVYNGVSRPMDIHVHHPFRQRPGGY